MATPYTGPREKVPSRAGRSEMSSLIKAGISGDGELDELQHGGYGRQHGCHGQMMGSLCFCVIKNTPFQCVKHPETCLPRCTHQKRASRKCRTRLLSSRLYCRYRNRTGSCGRRPLADYTAGGESHPAPKTNMRLFSTCMVARRAQEVKRKIPLPALYRGASILLQWTEKEGEAYAGKTDDGVLFRVSAGETAVGVR